MSSTLNSSRVSEIGDKSHSWYTNDHDLERQQNASHTHLHTHSPPQPQLQQSRRQFANASPLGLLAFATSVFLTSLYSVHARGVHTPNLAIGISIFFGGVCQLISGIASLVQGDTFSATVFPSYGAFNFAWAMIYLPGSGILRAYEEVGAAGQGGGGGLLKPEFEQALAMWLWAWFILSGIFLVGAMRTNWILVSTLMVLMLDLALQASGLMVGSQGLVVGGNGVGFVVCFLAYYSGAAGLWAGEASPVHLPLFPIGRREPAA